MKKLSVDQVQKLELISMSLERVKVKDNPIIKDMRWLCDELRKAYGIIEGEDGTTN